MRGVLASCVDLTLVLANACAFCARAVSRKVDMRERNIAIDPQAAITKDNVSVEVSGNLYVQFTDPEKVINE